MVPLWPTMPKLVEFLEEIGEPGRIFVVFECTPEQKAAWKAEAQKRDRTLSSFIRNLLNEELQRSGAR